MTKIIVESQTHSLTPKDPGEGVITEEVKPKNRQELHADGVDEIIAPGWDGSGFPEFSFDKRKLLKCICCAVDGGDVFLIYASNAETAKRILTEVYRKRCGIPDDVTDVRLFSKPSSWRVETLVEEDQILVSQVGDYVLAPDMNTLKELAKNIHKDGVLDKGCWHCGYTFPKPYSRFPLGWFSSSIGDAFVWECPRCHETIPLTSMDF